MCDSVHVYASRLAQLFLEYNRMAWIARKKTKVGKKHEKILKKIKSSKILCEVQASSGDSRCLKSTESNLKEQNNFQNHWKVCLFQVEIRK